MRHLSTKHQRQSQRINRATVVLVALGALATVGTSACSSDSGGITGSGYGIEVLAVSSEEANGALPSFDSGGTVYTFTSGEIHVRDIEIDLPDGALCSDIEADLVGAICDDSDGVPDEDKIRIEGPFIVDLLTGASTPSLSDVRIPPGTYKRVDIRIEDGDPEDGLIEVGDPLDDISMVAMAEFSYDNQDVVMDMALKFNEDIRFETPTGIDLTGELGTLLATMDVAGWFAGLDFVDCLDKGDLTIQNGVLIIDEASGEGDCSEVENVVKENIKVNTQLDKEE